MKTNSSVFVRRAGVVVLGLPLLAALTACGGRSVEAYCDVVAEHRTQYETAMDNAMASDNPLAGLGSAAGAISDLREMWDEAAGAAPDDIQEQVELVRDTWNGDLFEDVDTENFLSGLSEGYAAAEASFEAHQSVDRYTADNCPGAGGMFAAEPAGQEAEEAPVDSEDSDAETAVVEEELQEEPSELIEEDTGPGSFDHAETSHWRTLGPFLHEQFDGGLATHFAYDAGTFGLPGRGTFDVSAEQLLSGEEVLNETYTYAYDGDTPVIIGIVELRTPASGLDPEATHSEILVIDVSDEGPSISPEVIHRHELPEDYQYDNRTSILPSEAGVLALNSDFEAENLKVIGVDAFTGEVVWTRDGEVIAQGADIAQIVDPTGEDHWYDPCLLVQESVEIATGDTTWEFDNTEETREHTYNCRLDSSRVLHPHIAHYVQWIFDWDDALDDYIDEAHHLVVDLRTGVQLEFSTHGTYSGADLVVDPIREWAYPDVLPDMFSEELEDFHVYDLATGEILYTMDGQQAWDLELEVEAFFDGLLYVRTTDEQLVIDVEAGESIGSWDVHPLAPVGDYVWLSDGELIEDWEYEGDQ